MPRGSGRKPHRSWAYYQHDITINIDANKVKCVHCEKTFVKKIERVLEHFEKECTSMREILGNDDDDFDNEEDREVANILERTPSASSSRGSESTSSTAASVFSPTTPSPVPKKRFLSQ